MPGLTNVADVPKVGHSVLVLGASTMARANNLYGVNDIAGVLQYNRTAGCVVSLNCKYFPDAFVGKYVKVCANNDGRVDCVGVITSVTQHGTSNTDLVIQELGAASGIHGALGPVAGTSMFVHDMQSWSNSHSWLAKLNARCGANLDILDMACGSSNTADWSNNSANDHSDVRLSYIKTVLMPTYNSVGIGWDTAIVDFGIGNDMTDAGNGTQTPEQIMANVGPGLTWLNSVARQIIFLDVAGARLQDNTGNLIATPENFVNTGGNNQPNATYATGYRCNHFMRQYLAEGWPQVEFVQISADAASYSMNGNSQTDDMLHGRPPAAFIGDDGIHWTPALCDLVAERLAPAIQNKMVKFRPFSIAFTDSKFINTAGDDNSTPKFTPSGTPLWIAGVSTANLSLGNTVIGQGISGMTMPSANQVLTTGWSANAQVVPGVDDCMEFKLTYNEANAGSQLFLQYTGCTIGGNTYGLKTVLNNANFQGIDLDAFLDVSVYGFAQNSVESMEIGLFDLSGNTPVLIASFISDTGDDSMHHVSRQWNRGFQGLFRTPKFNIPVGTSYSSVGLVVQVIGNPNVGAPAMGTLKLRLGKFSIISRQQLV